MSKYTREEWLSVVLHKHVAKLFRDKAGVTLPVDAKVSVGFPGGGSARKRIGECWPRSRSSLKVNEIFINPVLTDPAQIVDVLVHEAIHASDDCASGHKGFFRTTATAVGLTGKMKSTTAGPELREWIAGVIAKMPAFDYGSLNLEGRKKQGIRQLKVECCDCGCVIRMTRKWLDQTGVPTCGCGGEMQEAG